MKEINLENSDKKVIVDDENYEAISKTKWRIDSDGYARGSQSVRMHRLITNAPKGAEVDHINNNKLDNRKANLRICNRQQNQWNKKPQENNTSGYKGVTWNKKDKRYRAQISYNNKMLHIGSFGNAIEAAKAYDKIAKELYGNYAWLNF